MIKAKTEKAGSVTIIHGFTWKLTPADMLIVMSALRTFIGTDRNLKDIETARQMVKAIEDSYKEGDEDMGAGEVKKKLIYIVMQEAYEEGIKEGKKQAMQAMTDVKAEKERKHKERMERDFSHHPQENTYTRMP